MHNDRMMRISSPIRNFYSTRGLLFSFSIFLLIGWLQVSPVVRAQTGGAAQAKVLMPEKVAAVMPATVFFRGQRASVQLRNTSGLEFPGGAMVLAGLVDSSGYSSGVRQKYQGYWIGEVPVMIEGKRLPAGAYGFGFLDGNVLLVMDLGAHELLRVPSRTDAGMRRPHPLEMEAGKKPGSYRLYEGRRFVSIQLAGR